MPIMAIIIEWTNICLKVVSILCLKLIPYLSIFITYIYIYTFKLKIYNSLNKFKYKN